MIKPLVAYLTQRAETTGFMLPASVPSALSDLFGRADAILPIPYKIYFTEETIPPVWGYPVSDGHAMHELEAKLDRWLNEEVVWNLEREQPKLRLNQASASYFGQLMKLAENSMMASLLGDYHGVFWLAHSIDLARHFSQIHKRVALFDSNAARTQAETIKYRIYSKWAAESLDQMGRLVERARLVLDGEEERGMRFFQLLRENVLILTEEFIGPDLRELKPFVSGYLHRDFSAFRDSFERIRKTAAELIRQDRVFRSAIGLLGADPEQGVTMGLLTDPRFQRFLFTHPVVETTTNREERDQFHLVAKRLAEYGVLYQLRRGITWLSRTPWGDVVSVDKRPEVHYSRATRPLDFGRPGVVDPMVHRFGLMYDISSFSETLGRIARAGQKEELNSYRQMLLFQRKIDAIAERYRLQFEKFLGDGAFFTTRRAMRMVQAAIEIQGAYAEMRTAGFAFDKGLRIAMNYGYYRLLPMKSAFEGGERTIEFYGPGVVELSRLTTGKATKEIEEIQGFLIAHGYDADQVQKFFAPLARGVDVIDKKMHQREFYAYVNNQGHLVNEGIVASAALAQELSSELATESLPLFELTSRWGTYVGYASAMEPWTHIGIRLIGSVSLKGLRNVEVAEIAPFKEGDVSLRQLDESESLIAVLRQHQAPKDEMHPLISHETTEEKAVAPELILCTVAPDEHDPIFVIGWWDPLADVIRKPVQVAHSELVNRLRISEARSAQQIGERVEQVRELYAALSKASDAAPIPLDMMRTSDTFLGFLLGDNVETI